MTALAELALAGNASARRAIVRLRIDGARATGRALPKESNEDCYEVDGRRIGAICRSGQIRLAIAKG
jgi:hypothetical protein